MLKNDFRGPRFTAIGPINNEDLERLMNAVALRGSPYFMRFVVLL